MAIVKASFTKSGKGAKASVRYIEHRPGKDQARITRTLFGSEGAMERREAYRMIDEAQKGSVFFRFVISPDPKQEDTERDLFLREITAKTMDTLEKQIGKAVSWAAAIHDDHSPFRHIHVVAAVAGRLQVPDFQLLRQTATEACLDQRRQRDLLREHTQQVQAAREEAAWERQR